MLIDTKTQLAKLLATENLTIEHRNVATAQFNTETRVLTIPILTDDLTPQIYDLFIGHEVGHALFTPKEGWHDSIIDLKIPRSILNVIEDARIEKLIKRRYPGLRTSFHKAYSELMHVRNFFQTEGLDLNLLNLLDRINITFKVGASTNIKFNAEEKLIVQEMHDMETFDDVVAVSKKLLNLVRKQIKEDRRKYKEDAQEEFDSGGDSSYFDDSIDLEEEEDETTNVKPVIKKAEEEDKKDSDSTSLSEDDEKKGKMKGGVEDLEDSDIDEKFEVTSEMLPDMEDKDEDYSQIDEEIRSKTDDAFRASEKELMDLKANSKELINCEIPRGVNVEKYIVPYKYILKRVCQPDSAGYTYYDTKNTVMTSAFTKFRKNSNKVVSYLVKEFELRKNADQHKRASIAKTGELNMNKVYSYKFNDDLFKRMTIVPGGKSHGLIMYLDWSGSMRDILLPTIKQLLNLVLFCKKVNIPFEVYAFSSEYSNKMTDKERYGRAQTKLATGDLVYSANFALLNFFSSKMTAAELNTMANLLLHIGDASISRMTGYAYGRIPTFLKLSYTPLNEAIMTAMSLVPKFRDDNKLQVVNTVFLTDGSGHALDVHGCKTTGTPKRLVIRDRLTGCTVTTKSTLAKEQTNALLKLLKATTESNIVGFYLVARHIRSVLAPMLPDSADIERVMDTYRKEKSIVVTTQGYDEYYVMNAGVDVDEDVEINVRNNSTKTSALVTAFTRYNHNKVVNRIILNRFINLIS